VRPASGADPIRCTEELIVERTRPVLPRPADDDSAATWLPRIQHIEQHAVERGNDAIIIPFQIKKSFDYFATRSRRSASWQSTMSRGERLSIESRGIEIAVNDADYNSE